MSCAKGFMRTPCRIAYREPSNTHSLRFGHSSWQPLFKICDGIISQTGTRVAAVVNRAHEAVMSAIAIFHQLRGPGGIASSVSVWEDYSSSQSLREQSFGRGPSHFFLNSFSFFSMNAHLARRIQSSATS